MKIPPDSLKGKNAFVTGGGSGIGQGAALVLARAGARVALVGRTEDELQETAKKIRDAGGEAMVVVADVGEADQMEAGYQQVADAWGSLQIVFANAGINGEWAPLSELSPESWDKTLRVNLRGTFLTLKYAQPLMEKTGGSIIITASVNGTRMFSNTGASAYATSKAGQVALGRMCALELARHRIRVNTICPGAIQTHIGENTDAHDLEGVKFQVKFPEGQIPLTDGQPGTSEQVGELVWFLASDLSRHISGAEVFIDGAQSLLQG